MTPEETEAYLLRIGASYRDAGNPLFADAFVAHTRKTISPARPGPSLEEIEAWERTRGVTLPSTLRHAFPIQDGGYVRGTRLRIASLAEMIPMVEGPWERPREDESLLEFGDPARLIHLGAEEHFGGIAILDGNVGPEPRILWLWRDLGDEIRDAGSLTFDQTVERLRGLAGPAPA
ncbi:SMI1/KNR4 family protein [Tundrisphaera sp. TA3]|uniref:SMI1/KNR4 family protein n=1 Tax=Tundrisphaera sp. TA3 TaxID=3435775 RepID=UPI003EBDBD63